MDHPICSICKKVVDSATNRNCDNLGKCYCDIVHYGCYETWKEYQRLCEENKEILEEYDRNKKEKDALSKD